KDSQAASQGAAHGEVWTDAVQTVGLRSALAVAGLVVDRPSSARAGTWPARRGRHGELELVGAGLGARLVRRHDRQRHRQKALRPENTASHDVFVSRLR